MNIFEKVEEIEKLEKEIHSVEEIIKFWLQKVFAEYDYEVHKVEAENESGNVIANLNYPVLVVQKGFVKENEKFYTYDDETVHHIYTLKDEKEQTLYVDERLYYSCGDIQHKKAEILYEVIISNKYYKVLRKIPYNNIIKQPVNS